jgi:hypothetical protein
LIVIALTLYVSQAGHKVRALKRASEDAIDRERVALAIEIRTALHDKKKITTVTMNSSLAGSIARLVNASTNLESASREIDKVARKLPRA